MINQMETSFPKNKINILLLENIHPLAREMFQKEGFHVESLAGSISHAELEEKIKDVSVLGIRSKTNIDAEILDNAKRLLCVGAFCIGTNQIDLTACSLKGVAVFNAPFSNTRSVVELAIGEIIMLFRGVYEKCQKLHNGIWDKSAKNNFEVRGKKLGIIGYGKIGSQLSILAEDMGMQVYYYDIVEKLALGNAVKCNSLKELLSNVDVVSVHVDGRNDNYHLIGPEQFTKMKPGVLLLNLSRGFTVDIEALVANLQSGHVRGAAIDVFPEEPLNNQQIFQSKLRHLPNVIITPHIGGSTEEAQEHISRFVPSKMIDFINSGSTIMSVNFPNLQLPEFNQANRLIHIHTNVPGMLAQINHILASNGINILGQYLKTTDEIGYVITDIEKNYDAKTLDEIKKIPNTIKFRVLY
jgi:D-3-phosphoglycerate dehydrogenase